MPAVRRAPARKEIDGPTDFVIVPVSTRHTMFYELCASSLDIEIFCVHCNFCVSLCRICTLLATPSRRVRQILNCDFLEGE